MGDCREKRGVAEVPCLGVRRVTGRTGLSLYLDVVLAVVWRRSDRMTLGGGQDSFLCDLLSPRDLLWR